MTTLSLPMHNIKSCNDSHGKELLKSKAFSRPRTSDIDRLVVLESGLGLESGLESVFAGLGLGLGLGLELKGLGLGLGLEGSGLGLGLGLGYWWTCYKSGHRGCGRNILGLALPSTGSDNREGPIFIPIRFQTTGPSAFLKRVACISLNIWTTYRVDSAKHCRTRIYIYYEFVYIAHQVSEKVNWKCPATVLLTRQSN